MTEPSAALAELLEISAQIQAAVLFDATGKVVASTLRDDRADWVASAARALLEEAAKVSDGDITQVEAATADGSLFVVREGESMIAATTSSEPTAGLVFYDLKSCLRRAASKPKPKPKPRAKRQTGTEGSGTS
ncbi:MAG TPA: roadblock/LC7 domain-containing protein [Gaiellaceae bacterium]|jgi:predicted regulator of Ras-like GTPase activity (Roadblock/LC7/MglB family)